MTNLFLKVNKDLFNLGLNPTEILLISQIMEFNTNTGDFFMSDKVLAEQFGVSDKTISRTMTSLEQRGFIKRETKNVKGGKVRHIKVCQENIDKALTKDNLSVVDQKKDEQGTNCLLSKDNLSVGKGQNDLIKDNIIDKERDNIGVDKTGSLRSPVIINSTNPKKAKSSEILTKAEMVEKFKREMGF